MEKAGDTATVRRCEGRFREELGDAVVNEEA